MLSPEECNCRTHDIAEKHILEKNGISGNSGTYTPLVGTKFHEDGTPRRSPDLRLICRISPSGKPPKSLVSLLSGLKALPDSDRFTFSPVSALYIPLEDGDESSDRTAGGLSLTPARLELTENWEVRMILDGFSRPLHMVLAWQIIQMSPMEKKEWMEAAEVLLDRNREDMGVIETEPPGQYRFNNLISFIPHMSFKRIE